MCGGHASSDLFEVCPDVTSTVIGLEAGSVTDVVCYSEV